MTPLYQGLIRQIVEPSQRTGIWQNPANVERLRRCLAGAHCFEVTWQSSKWLNNRLSKLVIGAF
jgi:hypothetical protein